MSGLATTETSVVAASPQKALQARGVVAVVAACPHMAARRRTRARAKGRKASGGPRARGKGGRRKARGRALARDEDRAQGKGGSKARREPR